MIQIVVGTILQGVGILVIALLRARVGIPTLLANQIQVAIGTAVLVPCILHLIVVIIRPQHLVTEIIIVLGLLLLILALTILLILRARVGIPPLLANQIQVAIGTAVLVTVILHGLVIIIPPKYLVTEMLIVIGRLTIATTTVVQFLLLLLLAIYL
jgi:antitoxin component of MazEF toxin-antitoxin module